MNQDRNGQKDRSRARARLVRTSCIVPLAVAVLAIGAAPEGSSPATAQAAPAVQLPAPPADGVMGFVVNSFTYSVIQEKAACPLGPALRNRELFLGSLPPAEAERLQKSENGAEFTRRWRASLQNAEGMNICTHYTSFPDRPLQREVQSKLAWGLDLDGDASGGPRDPDSCEHEAFTSPAGEQGIDNQAYRAQGCTLEWRGIDGIAGDIVQAYKNMLASGEWTQVILLRGVDSLQNDDNVEVIYGNSEDRPVVDSTGKYVTQASFTVSDQRGRFRNALRGRIVNGVLTTDPKYILLTQFPGAGGQMRSVQFNLHKARLRLAFQPDGSVKGILGGYQPMHPFITVQSRGGLGTAMVAGIDCAGEYNTMMKLADGMRDPKTGKCTAMSTAFDVTAVPAFVNDLPAKRKVASR